MAYGLTEDIGKTLQASDGLANRSINPQNLDKLGFEKGVELPDNFLVYGTQAEADTAIDKITTQSERYAQSKRVVDETTQLIETMDAYHKSMRGLRRKVASLQLTLEEAFGEWQTLKHKNNLAKKRVGLLHASDIENANIGFAKFERNLTEKLHTATHEGRGGSMAGSTKLRRVKLLPR